MKKIVLSLSVIVLFTLYSLSKQNTSQNPAIVNPVVNPAPPTNPLLNQGNSNPPTSTSASTVYKDGQFTGTVADAFYGNIQVQATIKNGKISDVVFLQYPNDRRNSIFINTQAMPLLKSEAIHTQTSQVDIVSGATDTSQAFIQSLGSALAQAH